jgi:hypothetical protein
MLNLLFELAAVAVFVWRMWPSLASIDWLAGTSQRQFGVSAVFIVVDVLLIVWLITQLIGAQGDITKISTGLLIASDHAVFIGVMTNAILGLLMYAAERRGAMSGALAQVVFWGVNIGLVGFLVGLIGEVTILKQVFTPIMGSALLIAIVAFILALRSSEPEPMAAPA